MEAVLEKMAEAGWVTEFGFNSATGRYILKWTAKGRERSRWVKLIRDELDLGPKTMTTLLAICHMHAPDERNKSE